MRNGAEASTSDDLTRQVASLRALARSLVRDESRAEDLVQDTLVVALERPPRNEGSLRGWLATVARHLALDRARGDRRRVAREERVARRENDVSPADPLERLEIEREVLDAVRALREPYRTTLFLRYWDELEPAAIAAKLGIPVKTVKSRISRALADLRARLDTKFGGGRERWMSALLPIAFPTGSAPSGSGIGPAGIAGGAWIVKKLVVVAVALLLAVFVWRATRSGGGADLAAPIETPIADARPEPPRPAVPALVEEARGDGERAAAAATAPTAESSPAACLLVKLLRADRTPAADVSLDVRCTSDPAPREEFLRRRTDAEGRVELAALFAGHIEITADRGSQFEAELAFGEHKEIELVLAAGIAVEGVVKDPDGRSVPRAEIWVEGVRRVSSRAHLATRTAADGSFRLDGLDAEAEIGARAPGFLPSNVFEAGMLPVDANGTRRGVLQLGPAGIGADGRAVDPEGRPVAGALVKIGARGGGIVDQPDGLRATIPDPVPVETDADGRFTYSGDLAEGFHPVAVSARGWPIWRGDVEAKPGARVRVDVVLPPPASVDGRVVDASGAPIAGARVVASEEQMGGWFFDPFPPPSAKTDADGRFRLGWIAPGSQELNASVQKRPELGRGKVVATCIAGRTTSVVIALDPGITVTGRIVDPNGRPVANWRVDAHPSPYGNVYPRQATTDELGRFLVANLEADHRYDLDVNPRGRFSIPSRGSLKSVVPGARDVEIVVANLDEPDARIRGRIATEDGRVPVDLQLVYYPEGGNTGGYIEFDGKTGEFEQGPLLAGRYELRIYRGGQTVHRTEAFDLRAGETKDIGVLTPGALGKLEVVLTGVSVAELEHARALLNREGHATETLTFESGALRSRSITPGKWTVELLHGNWFLRASEVDVRAGEPTRVELAPERGYETRVVCSFADPGAAWTTLTSRATDERGQLLQTGNIWFRGAMADGRVDLHGLALPAGRLTVEAWTDTGLKGSVVLDVGPGMAAGGAREIVMR